ncbi:MAG: phage head-tail connector protein [Phycisphaerales bacterium]|nr:phage head-tail connector protein [Phycisphaerales bacterium]
MLLSDIDEVKSVLQIPSGDKSDDKLLMFLIDMASEWIQEVLGRKLGEKVSRTEYYNGTGMQNLMLRERPVFTSPTIEVWVDHDGNFGATSGAFASSTEITYGNYQNGFCLDIDQDDETSRSGILIRLGTTWPKPSYRARGLLTPFVGQANGNIKVTYTAGYTIDTLPSQLRLACSILVAKLRSLLPEGMEIGSESYEERHIAVVWDHKHSLISTIRPMIWSFRNFKF